MPASRGQLPPVALVHDYFVQDGGAEAVAIELGRLFPDAPIHTTFFERDRFAGRIDPGRVRPWALVGRVPASPWFRPLLPAYIAHFSRLEVPAARVVISNSSTFARAAHARPPALHVAYIHSPMRFAWDVDAYLAHSTFPRLAKAGAPRDGARPPPLGPLGGPAARRAGGELGQRPPADPARLGP